ncbi:hypothetical protein Scep_012654 [Stephania cephalantha]|uniref:Uncharacterized protein n=1 Tax=Stephania cephalantha TaxID=152367 RepID=A0AAP0JGU2_9MAGN
MGEGRGERWVRDGRTEQPKLDVGTGGRRWQCMRGRYLLRWWRWVRTRGRMDVGPEARDGGGRDGWGIGGGDGWGTEGGWMWDRVTKARDGWGERWVVMDEHRRRWWMSRGGDGGDGKGREAEMVDEQRRRRWTEMAEIERDGALALPRRHRQRLRRLGQGGRRRPEEVEDWKWKWLPVGCGCENVSVDALKNVEVNEDTQVEDYWSETSEGLEVFQTELKIIIAQNEEEKNEMKIEVISKRLEKKQKESKED